MSRRRCGERSQLLGDRGEPRLSKVHGLRAAKLQKPCCERIGEKRSLCRRGCLDGNRDGSRNGVHAHVELTVGLRRCSKQGGFVGRRRGESPDRGFGHDGPPDRGSVVIQRRDRRSRWQISGIRAARKHGDACGRAVERRRVR